MIVQAREYVKESGITANEVDFHQSSAEELGFIENDSVDLITAGTSHVRQFSWAGG